MTEQTKKNAAGGKPVRTESPCGRLERSGDLGEGLRILARQPGPVKPAGCHGDEQPTPSRLDAGG